MRDIKCTLLLFIIIFYQFVGGHTAATAESYEHPELAAEAAVLMDAKTGQVLFGKNLNEIQYPASITKIMTGMLALEKGNLTDTVTMSSEAVFSIGRNSSHIALDVDEQLTLEQALYALAIASANDAANGIAEHISGSLESFAQLMNEKAIQYGAENTNFVNAHGLPDDNHYTTAYDIAKIMMAAIKTPLFLEIFGEPSYQIPPTNEQLEIRYLNSRNFLLNGRLRYKGISASKSGWTSQANHTLITSAKQGDRELIVVVMNNQSRDDSFEDTIKLLDYGFQDFMDITLDVTGLKTIMPELNLNTIDDESLARLLHKSLSIDDLEKRYELVESCNDTVRVAISMNLKQSQNFMYSDLGTVFIDAEIISETIPEAEITAFDESIDSIIKYYLPFGLGLIGLYIFIKISRHKCVTNTQKDR